VNACLPVVIALNARGWDVHFLALTTAYDRVIRAGAIGAGVCIWQARDLIGPADADILAYGERLVGDAPTHGAVSREESIAYHGLGYHHLVASYGKERAASLYSDKGRAAFEHTALADRIIDTVAPDMVLTTNSPRAEKALIDGAKTRGIPAVVLNDTLASASNHWLHRPDYANRILVLNEAVKRVLIASGHAPDKIAVTGNPAFEPMARLKDRRDSKAAATGGARKTVLYASQPLTGQDARHRLQVIAQLHHIASIRDDLDVRIRLHPNEDPNPDWIKPPFRCFHNASLAEELFDADALVTHGSTAGIEAALSGLPVVLQMGSKIAHECRFADYGFAQISPAIGDLEGAIERALASPIDSNSDASFAMPNDALANVVAELEAMPVGVADAA